MPLSCLKKHKNILIIGVFIIIGILLLLTYYQEQSQFFIQLFFDPELLEEYSSQYGRFAVFILLGLQIFQIVFAIIPGQAIGVAYGGIYGVYWGTLFGMIGTTIGTIIPILISKRYGRPVVQKFIGKNKMNKYDGITNTTGVYPYVILIFLPVIPDDAICYLAGLSKIKTIKLIIALSLARFPGMISLTLFGNSVAEAQWTLVIGLTIFIIIVSLLVIWKHNYIIDSLSNNKSD